MQPASATGSCQTDIDVQWFLSDLIWICIDIVSEIQAIYDNQFLRNLKQKFLMPYFAEKVEVFYYKTSI